MSVSHDIEMYKNVSQKTKCEQKKKSRNSNRRKPKNISNLQGEECDEIMNSLSNSLTDNMLGNVNQNKFSSEDASESPDHTIPVNWNYEIQRNVAETDENGVSSSKKFLDPLIKNVKEKDLEGYGKKQNCKISLPNSDSCKEENLNLPISQRQGNETHENVVVNEGSSDFRTKENIRDEWKGSRVQKSWQAPDVDKVEKSVKASEGAQVEFEEFNDNNIVDNNANFSYGGQDVGRVFGDGGAKEGPESEILESRKSEKKRLMDMHYPAYLTEREMNRVSKFGILLSGVIRINQKNSKEAYISAPDGGTDVLIAGLIDRNRALEGDEVYYMLKGQEHFRIGRDSGEIQRTAAVLAIKNAQHCRCAVGTLKLNENFVNFSPRDSRIPKMSIFMEDYLCFVSSDSKSLDNRLFYAKIHTWTDIRGAKGILIKEVGSVGDIESETSAILLMFDLDEAHYDSLYRMDLPDLPYVISDEDLANRRDLREECIFTIDPAGAKDLDDAVSCKRLPNGNFLIGVHISDVTHFLRGGTPLDAAVAEKATSVYLVQKVYHMLPSDLCELCSLAPGEDKLTFSVLWEMTPSFEIVTCNFTRSIINSCGKFSYDQVQDIIDQSKNQSIPKLHGGHTFRNVEVSIVMLNSIAFHLKKKRFDNGAFKIDQTKITFELDETGLPVNYNVYISKESHRLIEEFMLLANITVAERISLHFPKLAFLRSHSPPQSFMMKRIQKDLMKCGIDLDITSSKSLHESSVKYTGSDPESVARVMVLNMLLAKPMARAKYYCSAFFPKWDDKRHYALNVPFYTHFTSPIRRYADVTVHRLLAASLGYCNVPDWTPEEVQKIADNCNKKKYAAKLASEKSTELFLNKYICKQGTVICQGAVCDVKHQFVDCILIENGFHQRIYIKDLKVRWYVTNEDGFWTMTVHWPETKDKEKEVQVIRRFSIIKVQLRNSKEGMNIKAIVLRPD